MSIGGGGVINRASPGRRRIAGAYGGRKGTESDNSHVGKSVFECNFSAGSAIIADGRRGQKRETCCPKNQTKGLNGKKKKTKSNTAQKNTNIPR